MKNLLFLLSAFLLISCQDSLRTRLPPVAKDGSTTPLKNDEFRARSFAEVRINILATDMRINFLDSDSDYDTDPENPCSLEVENGVRFDYSIVGNKLTLTNSLTTMSYKKVDDSYTTGLIGTWSTTQQKGKFVTEVQLIFHNIDDLSIRKVCSVLK